MAAQFTRHSCHSEAQDLREWVGGGVCGGGVRTGRYRDRFPEEHSPLQVFTPSQPASQLLHPTWFFLHLVLLKISLLMLITMCILKGSRRTNREELQGQLLR